MLPLLDNLLGATKLALMDHVPGELLAAGIYKGVKI